jgi:iron complex transport system substrate-binding protein
MLMRVSVSSRLLLWLALCVLFPELVAALPVTVTDILGRRVTVTAPAQRIVSLAPSLTEQLFAVGAGEKVVGVTLYDNYPPQVQQLERVGGYVAKSISVEKILSLKPDLVLSRGVIQQAVVTALERVGIAVVAIEPQTVEDVYAAMALIGRLTAQEQQATQVVADMQQRVRRVREQVAAVPREQRVTVFYKAYDEPLITVGPATFIGHIIELAGGINIFADRHESYPQISAEEVLRRNPAVILGPTIRDGNLSRVQTLQRPGWQHLAAVQKHRIHLLDDDLVSRPGPRLADALEAVARALYPERFAAGLKTEN